MTDDLIKAAKTLIENVEFDVNGLHGKGGHGGLTSDKTLRSAGELRVIIDRVERAAPPETIETYYARQIEWSRETFGPALRTKGVVDHIRKELLEIEGNPHDLSEWIDVVILAMDGFWRHGGTVADLLPALLAKQARNMARTWPDWRAMSEDKAIEHDRSAEGPSPLSTTGESP